jgi:hypothetical protein
MAIFRRRPGLRKSAPNPHSSRSRRVRFGARWRARRRTMSCCLSRRFSAMTARTQPGPHGFAVKTTRCSRASWKSFTRETEYSGGSATQCCLNAECCRELSIRDPHARVVQRAAARGRTRRARPARDRAPRRAARMGAGASAAAGRAHRTVFHDRSICGRRNGLCGRAPQSHSGYLRAPPAAQASAGSLPFALDDDSNGVARPDRRRSWRSAIAECRC